ncbi:MAG: HypC/HybG/HupF family hydrogenase formation chaperone [Candidatus Saganbacteria bacterium]|nr:HypC/HybG/HupF family hydrogenase formation chaperone [Candidatus Saganbacteria bacterium]
MCLAIPVKIIKIDGDKAEVDASGIRKEASLKLLPDVCVGDYILIHAGFAIQKLDEEQALESLKLWSEINEIH